MTQVAGFDDFVVAASPRLLGAARFFADLSVETTAEVMQCSVGTVKSQTAKGLATLRTLLVVSVGPVIQERKQR